MISVVVPYFDAPAHLARLLDALEACPEPIEVVVADDGSPTPPQCGPRPYPMRVVRQADRGFRASAARHLGAGAARGDILVFLDADMVPEPACVPALAAAASGDGSGRTLAVGRRRHADLAGWTTPQIRSWFDGGPPPPLLDDPAWLRDGYATTRDLRDADDRSYRYVISAVMALPRSLYERAGGFDPRFVGYGGEDWDLAHRCWLAGADLRHVPHAVAWHDGPDLAGRADPGELRRIKDAETLALAHVLTDPLARGAGLLWDYPAVAVRVHGVEEPGVLAACASALLAGADAAVWFTTDAVGFLPGDAAGRLLDGGLRDPRVHPGPVPADVLQRARVVVDLPAPALLGLPLTTLVELVQKGPVDVIGAGAVLARVRRTRDLARRNACSELDCRDVDCGGHDCRAAPAVRTVEPEEAALLTPGPTLEARWAHWA